MSLEYERARAHALEVVGVFWLGERAPRVQVVPKTCVDVSHQTPRLKKRVLSVGEKFVGTG